MSGTDVTFPKRLLRLLARLNVRDSLKSEDASVGNSHPSETHLEVGLTGPQWLLPHGHPPIGYKTVTVKEGSAERSQVD